MLSSVEFKTEEFYSVGKPMEEVFWLEVNAAWFRVAEQLKVRNRSDISDQHFLTNLNIRITLSADFVFSLDGDNYFVASTTFYMPKRTKLCSDEHIKLKIWTII